MRIRNLYDPPTLKDRDPVVLWAPNYRNVSSKITDEGCEITVTGEDTSWLYPPTPRPDGLANVAWQKKDGLCLIGIIKNMTVQMPVGVTVLTRLCGFDDRSLVDILRNAGLPLVFAATDRPY